MLATASCRVHPRGTLQRMVSALAAYRPPSLPPSTYLLVVRCPLSAAVPSHVSSSYEAIGRRVVVAGRRPALRALARHLDLRAASMAVEIAGTHPDGVERMKSTHLHAADGSSA